MIKYQQELLTRFATRIFECLGTETERALEVAEHLVEANLKGHDSHGVGMIPTYVANARNGTLNVNQDAVVVQDKGAVLLIDGQFGYGQVVGRQATEVAIARARETGMACAGVRNNHHLGRIGAYGEQCVRDGMISVHFVNVVGHPPFVSPWGGRERRIQTNPFCCAVPAGDGYEPIVLDMATSAVAYGKVRVASMKGEPVVEGALFDAAGAPTTDAEAIAAGGSLGPFGKHKGSGLAVICELLAGALVGEWTMQDVSRQQTTTVNHMLMFVIDPDLFGGAKAFYREVAGMVDWLHSSAPARGFDRVQVAGEPERETMAERQENGIPMDEQTLTSIVQAARAAGMDKSDIDSFR
ncbi:MAG: malate/lactate/ureidoglycolate dehydrogenase [Pseudomonadota bacterium]